MANLILDARALPSETGAYVTAPARGLVRNADDFVRAVAAVAEAMAHRRRYTNARLRAVEFVQQVCSADA